jgi:hypothetical protein
MWLLQLALVPARIFGVRSFFYALAIPGTMAACRCEGRHADPLTCEALRFAATRHRVCSEPRCETLALARWDPSTSTDLQVQMILAAGVPAEPLVVNYAGKTICCWAITGSLLLLFSSLMSQDRRDLRDGPTRKNGRTRMRSKIVTAQIELYQLIDREFGGPVRTLRLGRGVLDDRISLERLSIFYTLGGLLSTRTPSRRWTSPITFTW